MGILILLISGISNSGPDTHFLLSYYSINIYLFFLNKLVTLYSMCVPFNREKKEKKSIGTAIVAVQLSGLRSLLKMPCCVSMAVMSVKGFS